MELILPRTLHGLHGLLPEIVEEQGHIKVKADTIEEANALMVKLQDLDEQGNEDAGVLWECLCEDWEAVFVVQYPSGKYDFRRCHREQNAINILKSWRVKGKPDKSRGAKVRAIF